LPGGDEIESSGAGNECCHRDFPEGLEHGQARQSQIS
jgi:hypothetical protein